jgi:leader peptidase (prepilin peptidase)/N-methyltransferase
MTPAVTLAWILPAEHPLWGLVALVVGAAAGRMLAAVVGGLLDAGVFADPEPGADGADAAAVGRPREAAAAAGGSAAGRRWLVVAGGAALVALWWWEVGRRGLVPGDAGGGESGTDATVRLAAHAVLFWLLAAATWIDLEHRVIPDGVTLPGVVAGLVAAWCRPGILMPAPRELPRSFGPPLLVPDVLAWYGGLRSGGMPEWMGPAPAVVGLLVLLALFLAWWGVCTAPWFEPATPGGAPRRSTGLDPRTLVLGGGVAGILAAWLVGGERFAGLASAIVGAAAAAGLVWSVREGASRALAREAMGLGDVTLMAMVGAWLGWQPAVVAFFLAAFLGLGHGIVQLVRHRESELPYGPSLCLATVLVVVLWRWIWPRVEPAFADPLLLAIVMATVVVLTAAALAVWRRIRG